MEGSRHERVAIVATAYVIGFITAFIAFGINQFENNVEFVYVPTNGTAAVADAVGVPKVGTTALTENGLVYIAGSDETLLSAHAGVGETELSDGVYTAMVQHEVSPDGAFVYFCEVPVDGAESCKPFIYSVAKKVVYPLTAQGDRIALNTTKQNLMWSETGLQSIGETVVDPLPVN